MPVHGSQLRVLSSNAIYRPLPPNVTYLELDVLKPFTLDTESFDVIHIRLLLYHVRAPF